ncbi:MAG: hypothetical protein J6330_08760 [Clostridia bacterium]|nr:hypothetical protein [Clostridia bacterium]
MKVLFIGNSYTYFYDMPKLFEAVCRARGAECEVDSVTAGGYTLEQFVSDDNEFGRRAKELLREKHYDYVVMQEQSVRPASDPELFLGSLRQLMVFVRENGAKPVLYETWGRADFSDELTELGWDHDLMQKKLRESYEKGAAEHNAIFVPAGERFHEAYRRGEPVFDPDGSHPSEYGSRLIAACFADTLLN